MSFNKLISFTKKVADLPDQPSLTPSDLKAQFDAAPDEVRTYLNNLIDALKSTTSGDSGAKNIGAASITGATGNDVQTLLTALYDANTRLCLNASRSSDYSIAKNTYVRFNTNTTTAGRGTSAWDFHTFTAPKNGVFLFNVYIGLSNMPTNYAAELYYYLNSNRNNMIDKVYAPGNANIKLHGNIALPLNSGDKVDFYVYSQADTSISTASGIFISQLTV